MTCHLLLEMSAKTRDCTEAQSGDFMAKVLHPQVVNDNSIATIFLLLLVSNFPDTRISSSCYPCSVFISERWGGGTLAHANLKYILSMRIYHF